MAGDNGQCCDPEDPNYNPTSADCFGVDCGIGEVGCGQKEKLCQCLGDPIKKISEAIDKLRQMFEEKLKDPCDQIDKCIDKVIDALRKKLEKGAKTCEQCKAMAASGLAGTLEYAVACAGSCISQAEKTCRSQAEIDKDPHCSQGIIGDDPSKYPPECLPCKPDEQQGKRFVGYCNKDSGLIVVIREGDPSPGPEWLPAAPSTTEQVAFEVAQRFCVQQSTGGGGVSEPGPIGSGGSFLCDIDAYVNQGSVEQALNLIGGDNLNAYQVQLAKDLGERTAGVIQNVPLVGGWVQTAYTAPFIPAALIDRIKDKIGRAVGCYSSAWQQGLSMLVGINTFGRLSGTDLSQWTQPIQYAMNRMCRKNLLTPDQALAAYLANGMSPVQLDTHYAVAGICNDALNFQLQASKSKPVPLQLAMMRRRELISEADYFQGMRQLGYLEPQTTDKLFTITENLPPYSDIIRMMVRDADDEALVQKFGLDTEFDKKFGKQLKQWAQWQGVPEQAAKYLWRSHWSIPSPGQLFEFWHRLRDNPQFGGRNALWENIKSALVQQDILPFWIPYFEQVSYRPLGRIDVRRAYQIGSLTFDEMVAAFVQLGYSDENAKTLAEFNRKLRNQSASSHKSIKLWVKFVIGPNDVISRMTQEGYDLDTINVAMKDAEAGFASGPLAATFVRGEISRLDFVNKLTLWGVSNESAIKIADSLSLKITRHPALHGFIAGSLDRNTANARMTSSGMDSGVTAHLLDTADQAVNDAFIVSCQRGIKKRYLLGELTADQARNELVARKTVLQRASQLVDWWGCERGSRGKQVAVSTLARWLERGSITATGFLDRLKNLGFSDNDAALTLDDVLTSLSAKRSAQAQKEAKEKAKETERASKRAEQLAKQAQREGEKIRQQTIKSQNTKERREKQLVSAAEKGYAKCDCELVTMLREIRSAYDRLKNDYILSPDEALQILLVGVEGWQGGDINTLWPLFAAMGETTVAANISGADET